VRGRVFGLFITFGGLIGNLAHWAVGNRVKNLGENAHSPSNYFSLYAILAGFILFSLFGLPCLHRIRKKEILIKDGAPAPQSSLDIPHWP